MPNGPPAGGSNRPNPWQGNPPDVPLPDSDPSPGPPELDRRLRNRPPNAAASAAFPEKAADPLLDGAIGAAPAQRRARLRPDDAVQQVAVAPTGDRAGTGRSGGWGAGSVSRPATAAAGNPEILPPGLPVEPNAALAAESPLPAREEKKTSSRRFPEIPVDPPARWFASSRAGFHSGDSIAGRKSPRWPGSQAICMTCGMQQEPGVRHSAARRDRCGWVGQDGMIPAGRRRLDDNGVDTVHSIR